MILLSESPPIRSETTTTTKTEEALMKTANSTAANLPEIKVKYATVKQAMQYNKKWMHWTVVGGHHHKGQWRILMVQKLRSWCS